MHAADLNDVFSAFFGGGGAPRQQGRGSHDSVFSIDMSLEDLYNGKHFPYSYTRSVSCASCGGSGMKGKRKKGPAASSQCPRCRGSGARIMVQQMGMMYQQIQTVCDMCGGTGECIAEKDKCTDCNGNKMIEKPTTVDVEVEKGLSNGNKIRLAQQGNEYGVAGKAGDLILVINEQKHSQFTRQGTNLLFTVELSIEEALCGFQTQFEHLDGRHLVLRRARGEVTRPGDIMCVRGEGMPLVGTAGAFGDLLVVFRVHFPTSLSVHQCKDIFECLPGPNACKNIASEYPCYVSRQDLDVVKEEIQKSEEADEDDESPNVGCAAQ